jgi:hypothetical protein
MTGVITTQKNSVNTAIPIRWSLAPNFWAKQWPYLWTETKCPTLQLTTFIAGHMARRLQHIGANEGDTHRKHRIMSNGMSRQTQETLCFQVFIDGMPNMSMGTSTLLNYNSSVSTKITLNAHVVHVLRYNAPSATSKWTEGMNTLQVCLSKEVTHPPGLATAILSILSLWRKGDVIQVSLLPGGSRVRQAAHLHQTLLGWDSFVRGQWHWARQELQAKYLQSIQSRRTGKRWATAIIRHVFHIAWDMWLHCNHIRHTPGGQRHRDRGRETDPLIGGTSMMASPPCTLMIITF